MVLSRNHIINFHFEEKNSIIYTTIMTPKPFEQMLQNQRPNEDIVNWRDLEEWEESISKRGRDEIYRCFIQK